MSSWFEKHGGPVVLVGALAVLLASVGRWGLRTEYAPEASLTRPVGEPYRGLGWSEPVAGEFAWSEPAAQRLGWGYDLFTPPAIEFDAVNGRFVLRGTPPDAKAGWELVAVKPELFRVQLAGYVGVPGDYRAVLVTPYGVETWVARAGQHFAELGLTLQSVAVRTQSGAEGGAEAVARVVLWDERAGAEVVLDDRGPRLAGTWLAEVRSVVGAKKIRQLRVGETLMTSEGPGRVETIRWHPPELTLIDATGRRRAVRGVEKSGLPLRSPAATQAAQAP